MFKLKEIKFHISIQDLDDYFYVYNPAGRSVFFCYGERSRKLYLGSLSSLFWEASALDAIVNKCIINN